jgi:diaminohydroxyphosphoribosylaminopyrimidine deaminase/5-amino-6-(5-phosphoribosylamino)uracil reductase
MPSPSANADANEVGRDAWQVLLRASAAARPPDRGSGAGLGGPARTERSPWLEWRDGACVGASTAAPPAARPLLDLYAPLVNAGPGRPLVVGHLGQSLDGYVATASGDSYYVTGPENVRHLHRLRALCAAVVVGAGTVECDDPRLTVRHVEGSNPVRVVIDPRGRLTAARRVFTDGEAETLLVRAPDANGPARYGNAEVLHVPAVEGAVVLAALLDALYARGLWSVFVEGGGATVSRFLEAGVLDRLQVTVAPLVTGRGRPGLRLAARDKIADCLRLRHRVFTMGADVLFDCDLRVPAGDAPPAGISRAI